MNQLLSSITDSKALQKAWSLDQKALFSKNKEQQRKLWSAAILICKRLFFKYKHKYPDNLQILSKIALIYLHQKKFILTKKYLDAAKKKAKKDPVVLFNYGNLYRAMSKPRLAINFYKKAIKYSKNRIFKDELIRYQKILKTQKPDEYIK